MPADFQLVAHSLSVDINQTSVTTPGVTALDWTTQVDYDGSTSNDTGFTAAVVELDGAVFALTEAELKATGDLSLDAFGFLTVDAQFEFRKANIDVNVARNLEYNHN